MARHLRRRAGLLGLVPAVFAAWTAAASEPSTLPAPLPAGPAGTAAEAHEGVRGTGGGESPALKSRLLRSLSEGHRQAAPSGSQAPGMAEDAAASAVAGASNPTLDGCPRALLSALLAEAAETGDAVSALAIEREILGLCRERQEIVTGIVTLEGELRTLLEESRPRQAGTVELPAASAVAELPIIKESAPVRVVSLTAADGSARPEMPADEPSANAAKPQAWSWFSIIGTAGDLRAGVSDGARVWFVREGDRLPGGESGRSPVTVDRIASRPPGVHVGGGEAALPYRPRPAGAVAGVAP